MIVLYIGLVLFLLGLNAFFALAEFAIVKIRPTRVDELAGSGDRRAVALQHAKARVDEYLSVCQVGVTLSAIGLGFVGEPAVARFLQPLLESLGVGRGAVSAGISIGVTYLLMSYLSIVLAELVPKTVALRNTERAALAVARSMRRFYTLFYAPLFILNRSAALVLRLLGFRPSAASETLSEEELRRVLEASHSGGEISFRQLLHIENVFDAGALTVKEAMKPRGQVRSLSTGWSWEETIRAIGSCKYSRFPLLSGEGGIPFGVIHVKDLLHANLHSVPQTDLVKLARPPVVVRAESPLQDLLTQLQRKRTHMAVVLDSNGTWTGCITMEDLMEEFLGTVEDEFETEPSVFLADALTPGRVALGLKGRSIEDAIRGIVGAVPPDELPLPAQELVDKLLERERRMSTYLGRHLAVPHARLEGLAKPVVLFGRSDEGVAMSGREDRVRLFFVLMTPSGMPHVQVHLLARVAGLLDSEAIERKLYSAADGHEILEAVKEGELSVLG
jgi:CBS domain containing-hemolysin-like protein/mannitol/fructose-specific phosphotransferase system IIA component (Ntr-type)